ncbi:MAG: alcohol dehydrogenase catalytic domain-containing protein [Thermoplasmata archaeon]
MWKILFNQKDGSFKKIIDNDTPLSDGKIRFSPKYYSVCGSDKSLVNKHRKLNEPVVIGHELSGKIIDGKGFDMTGERLKTGDIITILPNYFCGKCIDCIHGNYNTCRNKTIIGVLVDGGLSEYLDLDPKFAIKLPLNLREELGAFVEPTAVGVHALNRFSSKNRTLIILGGGGTGALAYIGAKHLGFKEVRIVEIYDEKIDKLHSLGFKAFKDIESAIGTNTNAVNILDTVSDDTSIKKYEKAMELVASGSEIIITGLGTNDLKFSSDLLIRREVSVKGSIIYTPADFIIARDIIVEHQEDFSKFVTNIVDLKSLSDLNELNNIILDNNNIKNLVRLY